MTIWQHLQFLGSSEYFICGATGISMIDVYKSEKKVPADFSLE
jgi:hypothetical protein